VWVVIQAKAARLFARWREPALRLFAATALLPWPTAFSWASARHSQARPVAACLPTDRIPLRLLAFLPAGPPAAGVASVCAEGPLGADHSPAACHRCVEQAVGRRCRTPALELVSLIWRCSSCWADQRRISLVAGAAASNGTACCSRLLIGQSSCDSLRNGFRLVLSWPLNSELPRCAAALVVLHRIRPAEFQRSPCCSSPETSWFMLPARSCTVGSGRPPVVAHLPLRRLRVLSG